MHYNVRKGSVTTTSFHDFSFEQHTSVDGSESDPTAGSSDQLQSGKSSSDETDNESPDERKETLRNLVAFWILGLCNNFGYVIMLSAAFDLLHEDTVGTQVDYKNETNQTTVCNSVSTGAILLADILPSLCIKLLAPFIAVQINFRVLFAITLSILSFIVTSLSSSHAITFIGVVLCSLSSGLGEVTFLSYSSYYHKNVVSTWSSGTGGAGVAGALSYASLSYLLKPQHVLQVMLVVPVLMAITYFCVLVHPPTMRFRCTSPVCNPESEPMIEDVDLTTKDVVRQKQYTFQEKIQLIKPLLKFMIPLFVVYFAEYFINQGLEELLYFRNAEHLISHKEQYRWYQATYQCGVLVSRSSVNLIRIKAIWVLPILQVINVVVLLLHVYFWFIPFIWIVLAIIFYEGLIGGAAYVNSFYAISTEIPEENKEFSMGITSLADTMGIAVAGGAAIYAHTALCKLPAYS